MLLTDFSCLRSSGGLAGGLAGLMALLTGDLSACLGWRGYLGHVACILQQAGWRFFTSWFQGSKSMQQHASFLRV